MELSTNLPRLRVGQKITAICGNSRQIDIKSKLPTETLKKAYKAPCRRGIKRRHANGIKKPRHMAVDCPQD